MLVQLKCNYIPGNTNIRTNWVIWDSDERIVEFWRTDYNVDE